MIDYETYARIRNYFTNDGLNYSQIAGKLGFDCRKGARWANEERYVPRKTARRARNLEPYKNDIIRMLETHPYTARQILQHIQKNV